MKWINVKSTTITFCLLTAACSALKAQETAPINIVTTAVPFYGYHPMHVVVVWAMWVLPQPRCQLNFWNLARPLLPKKAAEALPPLIPRGWDIAQDVYLTTLGGYYQLDGRSAISGIAVF